MRRNLPPPPTVHETKAAAGQPELIGLWMDLCMMAEGSSIAAVLADAEDVRKLLVLGLIKKRGVWLSLTPAGIKARDSVTA